MMLSLATTPTKSTMTKNISLGLAPTRPHYAVGLMSGTFHDGVSGALVTIDNRRSPGVRCPVSEAIYLLSILPFGTGRAGR